MLAEWDKPPPGYKPGQTNGTLISNIAVPLATVGVVFACLRLYVRACLVKVVGKDDWLLLAAVIFLCGLIGSELWAKSLGFGKHQYDLIVVLKKDPRLIIPPSIIATILYNLSLCCVQCSILAFYLRLGLAEIGGHRTQSIIYTLMGISIVTNLASPCLLSVFTMVDSLLANPKYLTGLWFTYGVINLLMDLTIWSTPLPAIFSIMHNLSTRRKTLLVLTFAVGMLSWCSSILRLSFWRSALGFSQDPTYSSPIFVVLYVTEVSLAMTCVSVAALRPLAVKITEKFNRLRGKTTTTTSTDKSKTARTGSTFSQLKESGTSGSKTMGSREELTTVDQELMEWKDGDLGIARSQFVGQTCNCLSKSGGDIELGDSCPRCLSPVRGTQLQFPAPTAINHGTVHRSSSSSSGTGETLRRANIGSACQSAQSRSTCDAIPPSESTVNLTNADTSSTTDYPRPPV